MSQNVRKEPFFAKPDNIWQMFLMLQKRDKIVIGTSDGLGCLVHTFEKSTEVKEYQAHRVWVRGRCFSVMLHQAACVLSRRWDGTNDGMEG